MEPANKKEIISFSQSYSMFKGKLTKSNSMLKYKPDGTTLNNTKEEMKGLLEKICDRFEGKKDEDRIEIVLKGRFNLLIGKSKIYFLLNEYYKGGNTMLDADGYYAEIFIERGLFAHKEEDLLKIIQDYLEKDYKIQVKS